VGPLRLLRLQRTLNGSVCSLPLFRHCCYFGHPCLRACLGACGQLQGPGQQKEQQQLLLLLLECCGVPGARAKEGMGGCAQGM